METTQEKIIEPMVKELLLLDLKKARFVKNVERPVPKTSEEEKNSHKIYTFSALDCPILMQEVGRLREKTFREAGGGTGKSVDIDHFDTFQTDGQISNHGFFQLIVWDPQKKEIVSGYRYARMGNLMNHSKKIESPSSELFDFSDKFITDYAGITIELGRSFIQPDYQGGLYSLENLFEGLGTIAVDNPDIQYFFGKVTMYKTYNREARNTILYYLDKYCKDTDKLLVPKEGLVPEGLQEAISFLEKLHSKNPPKKDLKWLKTAISEIKEEEGKRVTIPPLFKYYYDLSTTMKFFGTAINKHFGDVEETGLMVKIEDITPDKKARYIYPYFETLKKKFHKNKKNPHE